MSPVFFRIFRVLFRILSIFPDFAYFPQKYFSRLLEYFSVLIFFWILEPKLSEDLFSLGLTRIFSDFAKNLTFGVFARKRWEPGSYVPAFSDYGRSRAIMDRLLNTENMSPILNGPDQCAAPAHKISLPQNVKVGKHDHFRYPVLLYPNS